MAILNYTSEVSAEKTVGQIYEILAKSGAGEISFEHGNGQVVAVKFSILHAEKPLWFRIAPNPQGVLKSMQRDKVQPRYVNASQAHRTAWRIVKDAIEAQMAMFQTQQAELAEAFLPFAIDGNGESVYQAFTATRVKALKAAN